MPRCTQREQIEVTELLYRGYFGSREEQLRFAARYLPEFDELLRSGAERLRVRYGRFDWTAAGA